MRPGQQQNRRGRNRHQGGGSNGGHSGHGGHSGNRKQQNPLARSWESNGPDVKVRGTPHHIAEKYMILARDAQSAGDPVLAENYLQHAEHYNRIIMAYAEQQGGEGGQPFRYRPPGGPLEPGEMDDNGMVGDDQPAVDAGGGEQPVVSDGSPGAERQAQGQGQPQGYQDRGDRGDRPERFNRNDNQGQGGQGQGGQYRDRGFDQDRQFRRDNNNNGGQRFGGDRGDRGNRDFRDRDQRRDRYNNDYNRDRDRGGFDNRDRDNRDRGDVQPPVPGQQAAPSAPQGQPPVAGQQGQQGERRFDRDRDRGYRNDRPERGDRDRGDRFNGDRNQERGQDRTDRPDNRPERPVEGQAGPTPGLPQHERYVPERRPQRTFPQPQAEQPPAEWAAGSRPERAPERPIPAPAPRPVSEPVVEAAAPIAPRSEDAPAAPAKGRRKPAAPAAPAGERFQEHNQPSFLAAPRRRTKAEPKPAAPDEPKDD